MSQIRTLSQLLKALEQGYTVSNGNVIRPAPPSIPHKDNYQKHHFCIEIAGKVIGIETLYEETYSTCKEYLCDLEPEILISINKKDIEYEREEALRANILREDGYLETLAVYRKISEAMLQYDTFLMHGAVIAVGDNAYMFTAESGTGKTTHIKKWLENIEDAFVVNGDKPLIKLMNNHVIACGTPWCGKEKMGTNTMVNLRAIVLMIRGENNEIEEITYQQAFSPILQQTYRPDDTDSMFRTLKLVSQLKGKVRFLRFVFNNYKDDAFSIAYNTLSNLS